MTTGTGVEQFIKIIILVIKIKESIMVDINSQDDDGNTPLMKAILAKEVTKVKQMLAKEKSVINPNKKNKEGKTALMLLCSYDVEMYMSSEDYQGPHTVLNLVTSLLNLGADVNMKDNDGCTALMLASKYVHSLLVKRLLETNRVSDLKEKTNSFFSSWTALELASDDSNKTRKGVGPYSKEDEEEYMLMTRQKYVVDTLEKAMKSSSKPVVSDGSKRRRKADGKRRRSPKRL